MRSCRGRGQRAILAAPFLVLFACAPTAPIAENDSHTLTVLYPGDERILSPYWEMPAKFLMFEPLVRVGDGGHLEPSERRRRGALDADHVDRFRLHEQAVDL